MRRDYTNKKDADKFHTNLIKVMIKIAVLYRNEQFSDSEKNMASKLQQKVKMTAMTIVSFVEVDFTFDKYVLSKQINEARALMQQLIASHLTDKSKERVNSIFDQLGDTDFLEKLFTPGGPYKDSLDKITSRINDLIEDQVL